MRLWTGSRLNVQPGDAVRIVLPVLDGDASLPATVVRVEDESLRAQFDALSLPEEEALTMVLYSRADTWLGWDESRQGDHRCAVSRGLFAWPDEDCDRRFCLASARAMVA